MTVDEFFENPIEGTVSIEKWSEDVVNLQCAVIDTAIGFAKWLKENTTQGTCDVLWYYHKTGFTTTEKLFAIYLESLSED